MADAHFLQTTIFITTEKSELSGLTRSFFAAYELNEIY